MLRGDWSCDTDLPSWTPTGCCHGWNHVTSPWPRGFWYHCICSPWWFSWREIPEEPPKFVTGPRIGTTATKYVCKIQHECSSNEDTEHSVHHPDCISTQFQIQAFLWVSVSVSVYNCKCIKHTFNYPLLCNGMCSQCYSHFWCTSCLLTSNNILTHIITHI